MPTEPLKEVPAVQVAAPLARRVAIEVVSLTATVDQLGLPFISVPFPGIVTSVTYTPSGNITGEVSNNRTLSVVNKGSGAIGAAVVAERTTTATLTGLIQNEIALNTAEEGKNVVVAAGDILIWKSVHHSSGCVDPGGEVSVTIERHLVEIPKEQPGV